MKQKITRIDEGRRDKNIFIWVKFEFYLQADIIYINIQSDTKQHVELLVIVTHIYEKNTM